jgi:hypothetical protein
MITKKAIAFVVGYAGIESTDVISDQKMVATHLHISDVNDKRARVFEVRARSTHKRKQQER